MQLTISLDKALADQPRRHASVKALSPEQAASACNRHPFGVSKIVCSRAANSGG
jgi:hypothetical protein